MSRRPNFLDTISAASVTPAMLEELTQAISDDVEASGEREPDDAMWILFRVFGKHLDPHTLTAIMFRMEALSRLVQQGHAADWQLPGKDSTGAVLVHVALLEATARARLILSNRRGVPPRFDLEEFRMLALQAAEAEGTA